MTYKWLPITSFWHFRYACICQGFVHKWRHAKIGSFWQPQFLTRSLVFVVTIHLPSCPLGRDVIYGWSCDRERHLCIKPKDILNNLLGTIEIIYFWTIFDHHLPPYVIGTDHSSCLKKIKIKKCKKLIF